MPALQVHHLAGRMCEQHGLPDMQVRYTAKRGFFFQLGSSAGGGRGRGSCGGQAGRGDGRRNHPRDLLEEEEESAETEAEGHSGPGQDGGCGHGMGGPQQQQTGAVPPGFSVLQRTRRAVQVTNPELNALNVRLRDASNDCLVLTEQVS